MEDQHLTVMETAKLLRMSEAWLRKQIFEKRIKYFKLGRRVFIHLSTINDLIEKGIVEQKK